LPGEKAIARFKHDFLAVTQCIFRRGGDKVLFIAEKTPVKKVNVFSVMPTGLSLFIQQS
jgi:hypothetical protein